MKDATSQLRTATRRFKSDVANKLVGMFLHEVSRRISREWPLRVDGEQYEKLVRPQFKNRCPYCSRDLTNALPVVEHLDGMNRYRAGLHVAGNVLVACKRCNGEKRRDDSLRVLSLGASGWESFLSHDLSENLKIIRTFRGTFSEFERALPSLAESLPALLGKLYSDCQVFAETEIKSLLERFEGTPFRSEAAVTVTVAVRSPTSIGMS